MTFGFWISERSEDIVLKAIDLHKTYFNGKTPLHVLKGANLEINRADLLAVIGPSGAGKSTLLHLLGGLDTPSKGKVILDGKELYGISERQRARIRNEKIGFVFQFYHLLGEFTALENVLLPGLILKVRGKELKRKARELLEEVGLGSRMNHRPSQLSGGEQQRVALARALINEPDIVFCDEPTGNLDSENGEMVLELILKLNKTKGRAFVIVTHEEKIVERVDKRVYIRDGVVRA